MQIDRRRAYNRSATVVNLVGTVPALTALTVQWEKDITLCNRRISPINEAYQVTICTSHQVFCAYRNGKWHGCLLVSCIVMHLP